ncbi:GNAT family N-acetyltransferase [Georgenia sp. Z1491]|uniref:GNAT family N-acetyltransferase n=1 Tax=Georgenia sp. Z1491 TaxID=3416707 RepID=UPI003CF22662
MSDEVLVDGQVPTIRNDADNHRYVIEVDGDVLGRIDYRVRGTDVALTHTEVDQARSVPGLARRLVDEVLADLRSRGAGVLPYCPYVKKLIDENRAEYIDLVPEDRRGEFDLG